MGRTIIISISQYIQQYYCCCLYQISSSQTTNNKRTGRHLEIGKHKAPLVSSCVFFFFCRIRFFINSLLYCSMYLYGRVCSSIHIYVYCCCIGEGIFVCLVLSFQFILLLSLYHIYTPPRRYDTAAAENHRRREKVKVA